MKLKKLTIFGFKSFAEKVTIDFDCEIVGVVGPNGCGKSNIVDAVRWVLGEQSAKSLRGDKMEDVLFAGTDTTKPLNMAEVSVTLSEINGELPLPYDEITIARRLHRNGDSEYLINKQPVRLKDVQSLFLGSGIGKNTFSVFEQGKLDQVINLSPLDRRGIFDEAAGIGRFLLRKKETLRKLLQVSENYMRVRDIHQEVEKQTKQLKKQAAHAKNFQENKELLEELERALLITRWRTLAAKHRELDASLERLNEEVREEHHRLAAIEENLEKTKIELKAVEEQSKTGLALLHKAQTEKQVRESEIRQYEHRLVDLEKKKGVLIEEKAVNESKRTTFLKQIEAKKIALSSAEKEKIALEAEFLKERSAYESCDSEMNLIKKELKVAREAHLASIQEEGRLEKEGQKRRLALQASLQRLETMRERIEEKKGDQARFFEEKNGKQKTVEGLSKAIDKLKKEFEKSQSDLLEIKNGVNEKRKKLEESLKELADISAREKSLIRLKEECEGFSSGAKTLLKERQFKGRISGLFEVLKPKKEMIPALQLYAQTLVVSSEEDLEAVLSFAEKKNLTDFSIILLDEKKFLQGIRLVDDIKSALQGEGESVTQKGYYIDPKGVVFHFNFARKEGNPFLREAELATILESKAEKSHEQELLSTALNALLVKQKSEEEKGREIGEQRRKKEMEHVQENFALQRLRSDLENIEKELLKFAAEQLTLEKGLSSEETLEALLENTSLQQKKSEALLASLQQLEKGSDAKEVALQKALKTWQEAQSSYQQGLAQWQSCNQEIKILQSNEEQSGHLLKKLAKELVELTTLSSQIQSSLDQQERTISTQIIELDSIKATAALATEGLEKRRLRREELDKSLSEKRKSLAVLEKKRHQLEVLLAQDAAQKEGIEQELLTRHHLSCEALASSTITLEGEVEDVEKKARTLRVAIEQAGAVNMTAIEEYEAQAHRFEELNLQLVDLEEGKSDLEKIITKLDIDCRKIFKETFEKIRVNFQKNFAILFKGGEANLSFTQSSDVLEAGVEITAKPPGKQMRSISLLSGGEKCLTALALLFSIFEVRPAPFCILDEVDAPLDDSNIDRFTTVLKQYIEKTQFIIVTHNKKTMSIADMLLGVSMEERGISKLLTLSFDKQEILAQK